MDKENPSLPHSNEWPKVVGFSFEKMKVFIKVGRGHGMRGAEIDINSFNLNDWIDIFQSADCEWFANMIKNGEISAKDGENKVVNKLRSIFGTVELIEY